MATDAPHTESPSRTETPSHAENPPRPARTRRPHRARRIIIAIAAALVVVALAALGIVGNLLFDFALNPHAAYTMSDMMGEGTVGGLETVSPARDTAYAQEAEAWFSAAKTSVALQAEDGTELLGWYAPAGDSASAAATGDASSGDVSAGTAAVPASADGASHDYAVVCHGYTGAPDQMAKYAYHFHQMGMNTLLPAARGHERNEDAGYITMGWLDSTDLVGWVDQIVSADPEARILLFGVSMGGAEVMMASGRDLPDNVRLIIEDCGYTSVWDEFAVQLDNVFGLPAFPVLDAANLVCQVRAGYEFKSASALDQVRRARVPMLFIHGDADVFVPFEMLDEVYDACGSQVKEKLVVPGAGHGQASSTDPELYWSTVDAFIEAHFA